MLARFSFVLMLASAVSAQHRVWRFNAPSAGPFGTQVAVIGDRDGDGHSDIVKPVWVPISPGSASRLPYAWTYSGRTGQLLTAGPWGAYDLRTAGDVNGDGRGDYIMQAVGASLPQCFPSLCSGFEARSGLDDSSLWHVDIPGLNGLGTMMLGDVDLNGDGAPDALIGTNQEGTGHLYAISSTGAILYHLFGQAESFGPGLAPFVDYNNDGRQDFLLGMYIAPHGGVDIRSGLDGSVLRRLQGPPPVLAYGATVAKIGDLDNDGIADIVVGDSGPFSPGVIAVIGSVSGLVLRQWQVNTIARDDFGWPNVGVVDIDRDGFDDVIANASPSVGVKGQLVYSGRDGTLIQRYTETDSYLRAEVGVLPPQPEDPFPRWAAHGNYGAQTRHYMFSGAPIGVDRTGAGSAGTLARMPVLGLRALLPTGFRVTLSGAEPGAFAILVLGFTQPTLPYYDLSLLGFTGSYLYPQPDVLGFFQAGTTWPNAGYVSHDVARTFVNATTPGAITAYLQWIVFGSVGTWPGGVSEAMRIHVL